MPIPVLLWAGAAAVSAVAQAITRAVEKSNAKKVIASAQQNVDDTTSQLEHASDDTRQYLRQVSHTISLKYDAIHTRINAVLSEYGDALHTFAELPLPPNYKPVVDFDQSPFVIPNTISGDLKLALSTTLTVGAPVAAHLVAAKLAGLKIAGLTLAAPSIAHALAGIHIHPAVLAKIHRQYQEETERIKTHAHRQEQRAKEFAADVDGAITILSHAKKRADDRKKEFDDHVAMMDEWLVRSESILNKQIPCDKLTSEQRLWVGYIAQIAGDLNCIAIQPLVM